MKFVLLINKLANKISICFFILLSLGCGVLFFSHYLQAQSLITTKQIEHLSQTTPPDAIERLKQWQALIKNNKEKSIKKKLLIVNNFFNKLHFENDADLFIGKIDYWQTPIEFLIRGAGDCEDYAIAKYFTLVAMGVNVKKLRITYVKLVKQNQAHMVLTYYPSAYGVPKVLDNMSNKIEFASKLPNLKPVYSFNGSGLWLAKLRGEDRRLGRSTRLTKWRGLIKRMNKIRLEQ